MATHESTSPAADASDALHRAIYQFNELGAIARSAGALAQKIAGYDKSEDAIGVVFVLRLLTEQASSFATQADAASLAARQQRNAA